MENSLAVKLFESLAQESRLAIFRLLVVAGPPGMHATAISDRLALPPATLSFHLKTLCQSGLVEVRRNGRFMIYRASFSLMQELIDFLAENCCASSPGENCDFFDQ